MKILLLTPLVLMAGLDVASAATPERATRRELVALRARAETTPPGTVRLYEPRIDALAAEVDLAAMRDETLVASRLAVELKTDVRTVLRERARVSSRWSDFIIAHTVDASATRPISLEQILGLRRAGMAWTSIVYGMGLRPIQLASAVRTEARVATGLERPDGRLHPIAVIAPDTLIANHRR